jgi:hypothetical protein
MLVTLSDMKSYLGITGTDYDVFLTQQIELISEAIESYCDRKFSVATYTQSYYRDEYLEKYVPTSVTLYHFPVVQINSILEKNVISDPGVALNDFRLNKPTGIVFTIDGARFFGNGDIVEVEYDAGYDSIPATIQSVVYALVSERYNKKVSGINLDFGSDVQRISIPGTISVDFDYSLQNNDRKTPFGTILGSHVNVLDHYRSDRRLVGSVRLAYVD